VNDDLPAACKDCETDTCPVEWGYRAEWYMVKQEVWEAAGMRSGYLCIGCIESRLGRQLRADDFTDAPVNNLKIADSRYAWSYRTPRLTSRLKRKGVN